MSITLFILQHVGGPPHTGQNTSSVPQSDERRRRSVFYIQHFTLMKTTDVRDKNVLFLNEVWFSRPRCETSHSLAHVKDCGHIILRLILCTKSDFNIFAHFRFDRTHRFCRSVIMWDLFSRQRTEELLVEAAVLLSVGSNQVRAGSIGQQVEPPTDE